MMELTDEQQREVERFEAGEEIADAAELVTLKVRRSLDKVVPVRLSAEQWDRLTIAAQHAGTRPTTLLRMWVLERLRSPESVGSHGAAGAEESARAVLAALVKLAGTDLKVKKRHKHR